MSFINEHEIKVHLGLTKTYVFYHFSDTHTISLERKTPEEYDIAIKREKEWYCIREMFAEKFNESRINIIKYSSFECLQKIITHCNENTSDGVIITGDIIDYYSLDNHRILLDLLKQIKIPYAFALGNHEQPREKYLDIINKEYMILNYQEFKLISFNNQCGKFNEEQYQILKKEAEIGIPLVICMHIPIMTEYNKSFFENFNNYYYINYINCDEISLKMIRLIQNNNNIKIVLAGHIHGYSETFISKTKKIYTASSGLIGSINKIIIT